MKHIALILLTLLLAGCTGTDGPIGREQLGFPVLSSVEGVPGKDGDIDLVPANGLRIEKGQANLTLGLGTLVTTRGAFLACGSACNASEADVGMVVADGSLISHNDLALNARGPDRDAVIYFYDGGRQNGQFFRWFDSRDRYQLSASLEVLGEVIVRDGPVGTATEANATGVGSFVFTAALEGNEVAIYLRGSAATVDGRAVINFPPEFAAIVGEGNMTAQVTMTSRGPGLFVSEKTRERIVVETISAATGPVSFDYFVQAPRVGGGSFQTVR